MINIYENHRLTGRLLIVRHGPGRGRLDDYHQTFLDDLARQDPELHNHISLYYTGDASPDLGDVLAVIFWLGDPLRELYPQCYADALVIAARARAQGIRVVNSPEALSNTAKSVQSRLWKAAGIPAAAHYPFTSREMLEKLLGEIMFPAILRPDLLHTQKSAVLCENAAEVRTLPDHAIVYPGTLTPLIDTRAGYQITQPDSVWARYYHKNRIYIFGDYVRTHHVYFGKHPIVGVKSSTFEEYNGQRLFAHAPWHWWTRCRPSIKADMDYWNEGGEHTDLMRRAIQALGLDFGAIDYSVFADGQPVLWEVNPYFYLPPPHRARLRHQRQIDLRYAGIYAVMRRYLAGFLLPTE